MAIKRVFDAYIGSGAVVYIEYNDVNLRIGNICFVVPTGFTASVIIWDTGQIVFTDSYIAGSYNETVPGNKRVTEYVDEESGETCARLPSEIAWAVSWVTI